MQIKRKEVKSSPHSLELGSLEENTLRPAIRAFEDSAPDARENRRAMAALCGSTPVQERSLARENESIEVFATRSRRQAPEDSPWTRSPGRTAGGRRLPGSGTQTRRLVRCGQGHNVNAAILLPASLIVIGADRMLFTKADDGQLVGGDAHLRQIVFGGAGALVAQSHVVFL